MRWLFKKQDGPCDDPNWIRCKHCCQFFSTVSERSEHLQCDCANKPPSLSGTKGWRIVKRKKAAALLASSKQPVVILDTPGGLAGGTPVDTDHQGLVLGSVVCGDGDIMPEVNARLAIGRRNYNKLFRMYKNPDLPVDLRIHLFMETSSRTP